MPKRGALKKKRRGAEMGGAWSIDKPLKSKSKPYSTIKESIIEIILDESSFKCCCAIG